MSAAVLGIVGGGQLARMLAQAAAGLGVRCRCLDPDPACSASGVCEVVVGAYDNEAALATLARGAAAITYEFENVPVRSAEFLAARAVVHPAPLALATAQDRLSERRMFERLGIATPAWCAIDSPADLDAALRGGAARLPRLLKARRLGYDGKGQAMVRCVQDARSAWDSIGGVPAILDEVVAFVRELSVIAVRGADGRVEYYPLAQNEHRGGILRVSRAPAPECSEDLVRDAQHAARAVLEHLGYVGVLAVEFFQVGSGPQARLLANEIAPRVHNTGHWTIEGARTSQFDNHVRAVLGMELGPTDAIGPCAMVNAIGTLPAVDAVRAVPGAVLHDYHKPPRPGRKVGHVTLTAPDIATLEERLARVAALCDA